MIILADTPGFLLKQLLVDKNIRTWVYLGQNATIIDKVNSLLGKQTECIDISRYLEQSSNTKRSRFVEWIDQIAKTAGRRREWFFSVPSVKNPANSTLFLQVCYFFILKELKSQRDIDLVVVDSKALLFAILRVFPDLKTPFCNGWVGLGVSLKAGIRIFGRLIFYMSHLISVFVLARKIFKNRAKQLLKGRSNVIFIRSYITENFTSIENDILEKRYFPGLYDYLVRQGKYPVFLPMAIQTKNYKTLFKNVLASQTRIVFAEEFLKWSDYVYLATAPVRALLSPIKVPLIEGCDLSNLLIEEYVANVSEHGFLLAVLCFCLGHRFKENDIVPESLINWSEYQAFEKGLIAGLRANFPSMKVVAAHPFCIPPNHLCLIPSHQEKMLNIVPDRTLVLGRVGRKIVTQYLADLPTENSPVFRYGEVFKQRSYNPQATDLLALFGFSFSNAIHTLRILVSLVSSSGLSSRVLIKLHPLSNFDEQSLRGAVGKPLPDNVQFINGQLEDWLENVAIGICGATGTSVELVVRGIPVIIVAETQALTMNYLAFREDGNLWRICYDQKDFEEALRFFLRLRSEHSEVLQNCAQKYLEDYFAVPDKKYYENVL